MLLALLGLVQQSRMVGSVVQQCQRDYISHMCAVDESGKARQNVHVTIWGISSLIVTSFTTEEKNDMMVEFRRKINTIMFLCQYPRIARDLNALCGVG